MSRLAISRRLGPAAIAAGFASAGALLALGVGALALDGPNAGDLVEPLAIAVAVTVVAMVATARWLATASLRMRFVSIAAFAILLALVNVGVLSSLMLVSEDDAAIVAVLLIYAASVAIGTGLAAGRASAAGIERVSVAAQKMAAGDLEARAGEVGGGRELERLGATLDEMAQKLSAAQLRERSIENQRRDLIVAVSHDLRTPLADIQAMAEAIEDQVVTDPTEVHDYAVNMGASVESLARLVDDLFEFVQLDSEAIEAERERARVDEVVSWAVAACDGQAAMKGLRLHTDLGEVAGLACSPRLTRVLQNLLQNAIRHTPEDGTVLVCARHTGSAIELAVQDSGEGIEADAVDRVFEPFWRGDTARTSTGSGLGLALAKRIVESIGGTIAVESEPTGGSRFAVVVPVRA